MAVPGIAWERTRAAVPASTLWSAILVFALAVTIARSTVAALWVPGGIDGIPLVALGAAIMMSLLAVTPLPAWLCLMLGVIAGPAVSVMVSASQFKLAHPEYPSGFGAIQVWIEAVYYGSAFGDQAFVGLVITLLMWITGGWLAWCVVRWRQPLMGLIPGAAAFTTNVLNTNNQQGYTFIFLALTLGLLLWTTYTASVAKAVAARIKMTGDARWDFWETGLVATAALLVVGIMLPPISTVDRTQTMESSVFQKWADITSTFRSSEPGNGPGGASASTGFSSSVSLGSQLEQNKTPVFTYDISAGGYPGPEYFRGVNLSLIITGRNGQAEWAYGEPARGAPFKIGIEANDVPVLAEDYRTLANATFTINMVNPPGGDDGNILFYPGQLYRTSHQSVAEEVLVPPSSSFPVQLVTVDRLNAVNPPTSKGQYTITVSYPTVTTDELRSAGTDYAVWLQPYTALPDGVRSPQVRAYIHQLALDVTAGKTNPYDQASAIEAFLRDNNNFKYTLTPKTPAAGSRIDDLYYFLNTSHEGYCQYFAMAMGEMLRSLGIPTRLVSGYGPGTYDDIQHRTVVHNADAHVWVESYFPSYGWIPFEPTNDNFYQPIQRGVSISGLCLRDNNCTIPIGIPVAASSSPRPRPGVSDPGAAGDVGATPTGSPLRFLDAATITRLLGVLGALVLFLVALGFRYLRPRTVMGVWRRVLTLARLAGADLSPGETPLEVDQRLGRAFPEAAPHLHTLAGSFIVAAYAPPEMAQATKPTVMEAWASLRPMMVRRVLTRIRPGRS